MWCVASFCSDVHSCAFNKTEEEDRPRNSWCIIFLFVHFQQGEFDDDSDTEKFEKKAEEDVVTATEAALAEILEIPSKNDSGEQQSDDGSEMSEGTIVLTFVWFNRSSALHSLLVSVTGDCVKRGSFMLVVTFCALSKCIQNVTAELHFLLDV